MGNPEIQRVGPGHELRMILGQERASKWEPGALGGGSQTPDLGFWCWPCPARVSSETRGAEMTGLEYSSGARASPGSRWPPTAQKSFGFLRPPPAWATTTPPSATAAGFPPDRPPAASDCPRRRAPDVGEGRPGSGAWPAHHRERPRGCWEAPGPGPAAGPHPKIVPGEPRPPPAASFLLLVQPMARRRPTGSARPLPAPPPARPFVSP